MDLLQSYTQLEPKKWVIGSFPESNQFSVIPTNWLFSFNNNGRIIINCKWPPNPVIVTSDELKAAIDPLSDWPSYKVRLANNGKEYTSFNKAWHAQVKINYESSSEHENKTPISKKRFQKSQANLSSDSDSCSEDYTVYKRSINSNKKNTPSLMILERHTTNNDTNIDGILPLSSETNQSEVHIGNYNQQTASSPKTCSVTLNSQSPNVFSSVSHRSEVYNDEDDNYSHSNVQIHSVSNVNSRLDSSLNKDSREGMLIVETLKNVETEQNVQRLMLERLLSKIENIENYLKNKNGLNISESIILDEAFLSKFPINDPLDFPFIETLILNDPSFNKKLEYFIKTIGGVDPKNHIKRTLSKLFGMEYATKCTWTGRGRDIVTKIGDSELLKFLKKIVKKCSSNNLFTDSDFEKIVSEWFRYANTRLSRQKLN